MYMSSYERANIEQIKKIKSLVQTIKNFSANIFKSILALKKANQISFSAEELAFAKTKYRPAAHDEIVAVNAYVFLVGTGCLEVQPSTGSLHVIHHVLQVKEFVDVQGSFLTHPALAQHVNLKDFIVDEATITKI